MLAGVPDFVAADMVDGDTYTVIPAAFCALNQGILNVSKVKTGTVTMSRLTYMNGKYVMQMVLGNGVRHHRSGKSVVGINRHHSFQRLKSNFQV